MIAFPSRFHSHNCCVPWLFHPPVLGHFNGIQRGLRVVELLIMQFFLASCYFFVNRSKHFTQHSFLYPSAYADLVVWDTSLTPIKHNRQNYCFVYINLYDFTQQARRQNSELTTSKHSPNSMLSWLKFWFIALVIKYFSIAAFSKDY